MGVRRALSLCMGLIRDKKTPLCTLGPIIHNSTVINELEPLGVKSVSSVSDLKEGGCVLIRSHGITPKLREELGNKNMKICDATCPKVAKVQGIIRNSVAQGYLAVIIGDHGHAETQGLLGYSDGKGVILATKREVTDFISRTAPETRICVVAQTTQELEVFDSVCVELQKHFKDLKILNTICDATRMRQEEIRAEAQKNDCIIVAGGKDSANTKRLYEIAGKTCKEVFHIERASELPDEFVSAGKKILITAGASTPLWIIHEIKERLEKNTIKGKILKNMSSSTAYWTVFILCSAMVMSYRGVLPSLGALLLSGGFINYYREKLDLFRPNSLDWRLLSVAGLLIMMVSIFYERGAILMLFYYGILFYMVYKNVSVGRRTMISLCNISFLLLPLTVS